MNPYIRITRAYLDDGHLTVDDLEMLLAEKKRPAPKRMAKEQEFELELERRLQKLI